MSDDPDFFFDTVTLSNFALAGQIGLLIDRYGRRAGITPQVIDEILEGIAAGYEVLRGVQVALEEGGLGGAASLSDVERRTFVELLRILGPGEASCIACAKARRGTVVTDDRAARGCCAERDVPFTGTIGILTACVRDGTLEPHEADATLQSMIDNGYFSPVRRISDLL
jgi:predicted nucleic acid-binding protein